MGRYRLLSENLFYVLFLCLGFYSYVALGGSREGKVWSYETRGKEKWYRKQLVDGGSTNAGSGPVFGEMGSVTGGGPDENGGAAFVGPFGPGRPVLSGGAVGNSGAGGAGSGAGSGIGIGIGQCRKDWRGNDHCIPGVGIGVGVGEGGGGGGGVGVGGDSGDYASGAEGAGGFGNSGVYGSGGGGGGLGYGFGGNKGGSFGNIGGYGTGIGYGGGYGSGGGGGYGGSHGEAQREPP